jgi:DNA (cytosine-5)-methyltransferase 1
MRARSGPTLIDLFCGAGGFTLGFVQCGFRPVFAVDSDQDCVSTYASNFGAHAVTARMERVRQFPAADVVIGGPPCQGLSNLGSHVPNDPRNQLWREFVRCVAAIRPVVFVMENVPPLLASGEYACLRRIVERSPLGYEVEGRILNAADYGVPQARRRTIIIGCRIGPPLFPEPTHANTANGQLTLDGRRPWVGVRAAIGDLPLDPDGKNWHIGRNPTAKSRERYRHIPPGGNRWDLPRELMPECWVRKTKGGTDLFGRLEWDKPSVTIRTEFFKPEKGRYLHPEADRPITHREAARIQGFPDDFMFSGSKIRVARQIGNAVPVGLARAIAESVLDMLEGCRATQGSRKREGQTEGLLRS